ncbi:branched-chain amino acid ABC transporter permease [Marinobacter sp. MMG032]|uniref:Branched-chain amino acid ABC transporter permease n=1 Tax=Marinobacter sp. MMG032 TaxID=3158548 RepID=A0AAU7MN26_9GAMM
MNRTLWVILVGACLIAPFFVYPVFLAKLLCFGLFACAFNLLIGYTGLLSFGHAAFFGSAAYVCGYLARDVGLTPELAILSGGLAAGAIGYVFGALAIRRQGIYFAMITLALAQIVFFIALKAPITGGEDGLQGVPRGSALGLIDLNDTMAMYYFVMTVFLAGFWLIARIVDSPFGQVLKAIRENEPRALSLGFNVSRYKHMAFVLSAALAGVAGATKTIVFQFASLPDASWHLSGEVVLMTLLGGLGTILGPLVGAFTVVTLQSELSGFGSWVTVAIGLTFIVCVLLFRRGIVGELEHLFRKRLGSVKVEQKPAVRAESRTEP